MNRPPRPATRGALASGDAQGLLLGAATLATVAAAIGVWGAVALTSPPGYTGGGPPTAIKQLATGQITWTTATTVAAVSEVVLLAALTIAAVVLVVRRRRGRGRVDHAATRMARRKDLAELAPTAVAASARRLRPGMDPATTDPDQHGVLIGHTVDGNIPLRQSWEHVAVDIWGTRTGKTTARAIPAIVAAPGPVLATSVKADVVDATRGPRNQRGRTWVFDPQDLHGDPQSCWWNPLAAVGDITAARRLAGHLASAEREPGTTRDAFFDPEAEDLVAGLLLAAASSGAIMADAFVWATRPGDEEPARILKDHGHTLPARSVYGVIGLPDRTRGGVYGGAKRLLAFLTEPRVTRWITPQPGLPGFDPATFVSSTDTLYLLSQGGPGSPAPLVAAFADAVLHAGEQAAARRPGGRLDPPLLSVLDEAANIVRLRNLPNQFSHYGSRGLPVIAILQSYAQGEEVWGTKGMRKLWDAANIRTYGGGNGDTRFLGEISQLIGDHDIETTSTSATRDGQTVTRQTQRRRILDVVALAALPRGRMIVIATGAPVVLAKTQPWHDGPHADAIRQSLATREASASATSPGCT